MPRYLDIEQVVRLPENSAATRVHPGYGFLSENARFRPRCVERRHYLHRPAVEILELFGDKARARVRPRTPTCRSIRGIDRAVTLDEASDFFDASARAAG